MNQAKWRVRHVGPALLVLALALLLFAVVFPLALLFLPLFVLPPPGKKAIPAPSGSGTPRSFFPAPLRGRAPPF